jgi:hypothetical protein
VKLIFPSFAGPSLRWLASAALLACAAGCVDGDFVGPKVIGPVFAPTNHAGVARLPVTLRRIAVLPVLGGGLVSDGEMALLEPAVLAALQRTQRFETVPIDRAKLERMFGAAQLSPVAVLPRDIFSRLKDEYAVDGVLFVEITAYTPYAPLKLGLRARLVGLDASTLWSFDTLFSAAEPAVANSARLFALGSNIPPSDGIDLSETVLQSPAQFASFAATEMFATLPPR